MFNHKLSLVKPSPTLAMTARAKDLADQGHNVISLTVGEPDFDTPDNIKAKAIEAINKGYTKYTPVSGIKELKQAVCEKFKRDNQLSYAMNEVMVSVGAKQIIFNAMLATLNGEDEVIILAPYWVSYIDIVLIAGGQPVIVDCKAETDFKVSAQQLKRSISPKTKWIILNSPSNPTGSVYSYQELREIADVLLEYPHVNVLSDDIYEHIIFDNQKFYTLAQVEPKLKERVLTVNGVSKSYSMTGWRIGYCGGNKELIKAMDIIQSQSTSNPCSISQYAALEALNGPQDVMKKNAEIFQKRRDLLLEQLKSVPGLKYRVPGGAFYLFINCEKLIGTKTREGKQIQSSNDFCEYLLDTAKVAVVDGGAFGMEGYYRLSYAVNEDKLKEGVDRIAQVCKDLLRN